MNNPLAVSGVVFLLVFLSQVYEALQIEGIFQKGAMLLFCFMWVAAALIGLSYHTRKTHRVLSNLCGLLGVLVWGAMFVLTHKIMSITPAEYMQSMKVFYACVTAGLLMHVYAAVMFVFHYFRVKKSGHE